MVHLPLRSAWVLVPASAVVFLACSGQMPAAQNQNPNGTVQAISPSDKAEGAKAHPQLVREFGGAVTGPQASYVEGVGKNIAVQSGLGNARSDFTVTLLNSPVNNAFAVPGGYVYVTRQLVALMNNEAELAGVLGHEVGHVAARHAAKRESAATRNSILGVLGTVLTGALLGNSALGQIGQKIFSTGSQLLTLKYSRGQESEADALGVSYLRRAGYDPRAMGSVLRSLANQNALDAQLLGTTDRVPAWASTHPDPASRVSAALALAGTNPRGLSNRDSFLSRIGGLTYGDDPAQGIVDGRNFIHPVLGFAFQAPVGFTLLNGTQSITINGQSGKGQFVSAAYNGDLAAHIRGVFAGLSNQQQIAPDSIQTTNVGGIPAAYGTARSSSDGNPVDIVVFAYAWSGQQAFHFTTISQAGQAGEFEPMFTSLRRVTPAEARSVRVRKLAVVAVKKGDTPATLAARMAYSDRQLDRFLVLNALAADSQLVPGSKVKLIVY
jgi:predicted Zn-dependent protease